MYFQFTIPIIKLFFFWIPKIIDVPVKQKDEVKQVSKVPIKSTMSQLIRSVHTDSRGIAFGGQILAWMDVCAGVSAKRHANGPCVTAAVDAVHFLKPIHENEICIITACVNRSWSSSMEIGVTVETENMETGDVVICCFGFFTFVALPKRQLPSVTPSSMRERRRYHEAQERRDRRLRTTKELPQPCYPYTHPSLDSGVDDPKTRYGRSGSFSENRTLRIESIQCCSDTYTEVIEIVFPEHCNSLGITFGGQIMKWMEYCATMAANRLFRTYMLIASIDSITFLESTKQGDIITVRAMVSASYTHSVEVYVTVEAEDVNGNQRVTNDGWISIVSVDENGFKLPVPKIKAISTLELARQNGSAKRKLAREQELQLLKSYLPDTLSPTKMSSK
ncbi:HotDog domain-containing protein [Globomyces pollinis-pini]|nr:HotDog domain-containing protein [Globomyces pollinis-pini]